MKTSAKKQKIQTRKPLDKLLLILRINSAQLKPWNLKWTPEIKCSFRKLNTTAFSCILSESTYNSVRLLIREITFLPPLYFQRNMMVYCRRSFPSNVAVSLSNFPNLMSNFLWFVIRLMLRYALLLFQLFSLLLFPWIFLSNRVLASSTYCTPRPIPLCPFLEIGSSKHRR